jgi:hypothetical protein
LPDVNEREEGRGTEDMRKTSNEEMGKDVVGRREGETC